MRQIASKKNSGIGVKNATVANNTFLFFQFMSTLLGQKNSTVAGVSASRLTNNSPHLFGPNHPMQLFTDELWNILSVFVYNTLSQKGLIKPMKKGRLEVRIPRSISRMPTSQSESIGFLVKLKTTASSLLSLTSAPPHHDIITGTSAEILEFISERLKYSSVVEEKSFKRWCRDVKANPELLKLINTENSASLDRKTELLLEIAKNNSLPQSFSFPDCPYTITIGGISGQTNLCRGQDFSCMQGGLFDGTTLIAHGARWAHGVGKDDPDFAMEFSLRKCYPGSQLLSDICNSLPSLGNFSQTCPLGTTASYEKTSYAGNVILLKTSREPTACLIVQNTVGAAFNGCLNNEEWWHGEWEVMKKYGFAIYGGIGFLVALGTFCNLQCPATGERQPLLSNTNYDSSLWSASANVGIAVAAGVLWPTALLVCGCAR